MDDSSPKPPPDTPMCVEVDGVHYTLKKNFWQVCDDPTHPDHEAYMELLHHLRQGVQRESKTEP